MTSMTTSDYWTLTAASVCVPCDTNECVCDPDADWDLYRFGLCRECNCGLDDEADFVVTGSACGDTTVLLCCDCWCKMNM